MQKFFSGIKKPPDSSGGLAIKMIATKQIRK